MWIKRDLSKVLQSETTFLPIRVLNGPDPLMLSPYFGHMIENCAVNEASRFFNNQGMQPALYFLRNNEKVEIERRKTKCASPLLCLQRG